MTFLLETVSVGLDDFSPLPMNLLIPHDILLTVAEMKLSRLPKTIFRQLTRQHFDTSANKTPYVTNISQFLTLFVYHTLYSGEFKIRRNVE